MKPRIRERRSAWTIASRRPAIVVGAAQRSGAAGPCRLKPGRGLGFGRCTLVAPAWLLATILVLLPPVLPRATAAALASWATAGAVFVPADTGSWLRVSSGAVESGLAVSNYLAPGQRAPILCVRLAGPSNVWHAPSLAGWDATTRRLTLRYPQAGAAGATVVLRVDLQPTHLALEVLDAQPLDRIGGVLWGPYPTIIGETVGEVVGVVRDGQFALGLLALNPKTLGGYPETDEGSTDRPYAARAMPWGSQLQAYALDRSRPRVLDVWGRRAPRMPVEAIPGETVVGSRIALFGGPPGRALETIGAIELAEGLPHPLIDGVWAKISPERGRSYLIADFSEGDIDELLGHVKRANFMSLYHGNAFQSWGHYRPSARFFPSGVAGLKACATKARAQGVRLGAHTLSNFIQTHDAYVTPVPDPRLVLTGSSPLAADVDAVGTVVPVDSPEYFAQKDRNELHTVRIGSELVRYRAVSEAAPWRLLDCQRGAFGTTPAAHARGVQVGKLMDHSYKVFFPNLELQREIAGNLARVFNETGLSHMDFDGHEGCLASGQGTYGNELFAKAFHDALDHTVINGTSPPLSHFYWHFNSYCNWGEPWYGGFRDSMQQYRINNQAFCERNYIPKMLGWYLLTPSTCLSDMEWMLARAAGYDAGFALATSLASLRKNPESGRILDAIREWELARRQAAFPETLREPLRNPRKEFHLERVASATPAAWDLYPFVDSPAFQHENAVRQPGEPTAAEWTVANPHARQPVQFKLRVGAGSGAIANPTLEVNRAATCRIPAEIQAGQSLLVEADGVARIYDAKGNAIKSVPLADMLTVLQPGENRIQFDCEFRGDTAPHVAVTFKTMAPAVRVTAPAMGR